MGWLSFDNRGRNQKSTALDLPVGSILPSGLNLADIPDGWLECDGSAVNAVLYPDLAAFLTAEGWGSNLPDARGRTPIGVGTHASVSTMGASDGLAVGSRSPSHVHNVPGHPHSVLNHTHPYAAHQHASASHTHIGELHQHDLASHGHTVSGSTAATANGHAEVDFGTPGVERICFEAHAHGNGSLGGDQNDVGWTNQAGNAPTGGPIGQVNGGLTGASVAGVTGANTDALSANAAADSASASVPFQTGRFIIKAVA